MSCAFINVPSICEFMETLKENEPHLSDEFCSDFASISWNLATYTGESLGPIMGGFISTKSNFTVSCLSTSMLNLSYLSVYLIFARKRIYDFLFKDEEFNNNLYYSFSNEKNQSMVSFDSLVGARRKPFVKRASLMSLNH